MKTYRIRIRIERRSKTVLSTLIMRGETTNEESHLLQTNVQVTKHMGWVTFFKSINMHLRVQNIM